MRIIRDSVTVDKAGSLQDDRLEYCYNSAMNRDEQ